MKIKKKKVRVISWPFFPGSIREEPEAKEEFPQSDLGQGNLFTSLLPSPPSFSLTLPQSFTIVLFYRQFSLCHAVVWSSLSLLPSHVPIYRPAARLLRLAPFGLLRELIIHIQLKAY